MSDKIKIKDTDIAELQQYWVPVASLREKLMKLKKEAEFLMVQQSAGRALFWRRIEELYPETQDGNWHVDTDEWEINPAEKNEPPNIPDLLKGLLGGE